MLGWRRSSLDVTLSKDDGIPEADGSSKSTAMRRGSWTRLFFFEGPVCAILDERDVGMRDCWQSERIVRVSVGEEIVTWP